MESYFFLWITAMNCGLTDRSNHCWDDPLTGTLKQRNWDTKKDSEHGMTISDQKKRELHLQCGSVLSNTNPDIFWGWIFKRIGPTGPVCSPTHTIFFLLVLWTQKGVLLINTNIRGLWIKMGPPKAWVSILKMVQLLDDLGCPKTSGNLLFNRRVSLIYHQRFWSTPSFFCFKSGTLTGWWCNNHLEKYESQWEGWHPIYYGK